MHVNTMTPLLNGNDNMELTHQLLKTNNKMSEEDDNLRLRVQNICCPKEVKLITDNLDDIDGIKNVTVNAISRTAYIRYSPLIITSAEIIDRLNSIHLGVSIIESGDEADVNNKRTRLILNLKIFNVIIMTILGIICIILALVSHSSIARWLIIPVIVLAVLPMLWKVINDVRRRIFIGVNLLMLVSIVGTLMLDERVDAVIISYVFAIAEILEVVCRYKVERDISGLLHATEDIAVLAETNESMPAKKVQIGTSIIICAGERIPLDGVVMDGKASVDESAITGESVPVSKLTGSLVFSGTIVQTGYLKVKTTCDYSTSTVSRVKQLVEEAQSQSSRTEEIINKFTKYYSPGILFAAFLIFAAPFILYKIEDMGSDEFKDWSKRALIILLVACPCSLIMATPVPMICGITKAIKLGALVKGGVKLEKLAQVSTIVFDKTGTLTEGRFQVINEHYRKGLEQDTILQLAASLETKSAHPLASTVVNHYSGCITDMIDEHGDQIGLPEVTEFMNENGMGLKGIINNHEVLVGNEELMLKYDVVINDEMTNVAKQWIDNGFTTIFVTVDKEISLVLGLADRCRSSSSQAISALHKADINCIMLTGDSDGPARMIQQEVGLSQCLANMKPQDKYEWIAEFKKREKKKRVIAMIGDGINDCPSLALADVGIAIGSSATALAVESADISLMSDNLLRIIDLINLSKHIRNVIYQNIIGSIAIKLIFVIAAFAYNDTLWLAVLADVTGLVYVSLNGLRPIYWKPTTDEESKQDINLIEINYSVKEKIEETE